MNREKLRELRKQFGNTVTGEIIDAILEDEGHENITERYPRPRVDRSLRGWVIVDGDLDGAVVYWADEEGLVEGANMRPVYLWDEVEKYGWTVRKLTPEDIGHKARRVEEWSMKEREEFLETLDHLPWGPVANKAIDIALRGTHE